MAGLLPQSNSQRTKGKSEQNRTIPKELRPALQILERILMGQMTDPPNTAISVPQQQAISNLQGGFGGMAANLGVGSGGRLAPGPDQAGLQTREQLGLPDRRSYMGAFLPTAEDVAALGAVPGIPSTPGGKKAIKKVAKGKPAPHHPEVR